MAQYTSTHTGAQIDTAVTDVLANSSTWTGKQDKITSSNTLSADLTVDGSTNHVFTAADDTKLAGIAAGAEVNVQANWNETSTSSDAYIQNKPTLGAAAAKGVDTSIASGTTSTNLPTSAAVYNALQAVIKSGTTTPPTYTPTYHPALYIDTTNYIMYVCVSGSTWTALGAVYKG